MPFVQFRVHPSVGCARMGNSENAYYLASEFPQFMQELFPNLRFKPKPRRHPKEFFTDETSFVAEGDLAQFEVYRSPAFQTKYTNKFKEDVGIIFPQAARFRIFAYVYGDDDATHPDTVFEVTTEIADIEWKVNIANKKSKKTTTPKADPSPNLTETSSDLTTSGAALVCRRVLPVVSLPILAYTFLERDETDKSKVTGRLHVIGNEGDLVGDTPQKTLWSDNWYDSAGDGPVEAIITPKQGGELLRAKVGAASLDDLKYLEYGFDVARDGSATTIQAMPGWVVVGCPDYVPDMGHFVSLWDLAFSRAVSALDARQVRPQTGRHNLIVLKSKAEQYLKMDYFVHIHPQLCLFEDVRYVSAVAFGVRPNPQAELRGHSNQPLFPPPPPPDVNNDVTLAKKVEHGGMFFDARSRKAQLADETMLKDPDSTKPIGEWLKVAIFQRLRKPGTLYDRKRQFILDPPGPESDSWHDGVFPRKLGRRMDYDNEIGEGDKNRFYDMIRYKSPPGNLRRFHGLKDKGHYCGGDKSPALVGPADKEPLTDKERELLGYLDDMYWPASSADMPMLRELAYTYLQYDQFGIWQAIDFVPRFGQFTEHNVRSGNIFSQIMSPALEASFATASDADEHFSNFLATRPTFAPSMIDMAHLGAMIGGSFLPGIEVGREAGIAANWCLFHGGTIHFPDVRFKPCDDIKEHTVGTLTKDLAVPWTEDFKDCDETFWPTSRPGIGFLSESDVNVPEWHAWMIRPATIDENGVRQPGDVIPHLHSDALGVEYLNEYWKALGFIRRTANDKFIVAE